jgi:hypothetical protein
MHFVPEELDVLRRAVTSEQNKYKNLLKSTPKSNAEEIHNIAIQISILSNILDKITLKDNHHEAYH